MLEIDAGGFSFRARLEEEAAPATVAAFRGCCRSSRASSTSAGAARRAGSRSASSTSASARRTRPATRIPARSCSTRAAYPRRRSCSPTATSASRRRPASSRGTTSRRSSRAVSTSGSSARSSSGKARRRSSSASLMATVRYLVEDVDAAPRSTSSTSASSRRADGQLRDRRARDLSPGFGPQARQRADARWPQPRPAAEPWSSRWSRSMTSSVACAGPRRNDVVTARRQVLVAVREPVELFEPAHAERAGRARRSARRRRGRRPRRRPTRPGEWLTPRSARADEEHPRVDAGGREDARVVAGAARELDDGSPRASIAARRAPCTSRSSRPAPCGRCRPSQGRRAIA